MQLGQRLKFQASLANVESNGFEELRKEATLAYVAAGRLEKVVNIWIMEMTKENYLRDSLLGRMVGAACSTLGTCACVAHVQFHCIRLLLFLISYLLNPYMS